MTVFKNLFYRLFPCLRPIPPRCAKEIESFIKHKVIPNVSKQLREYQFGAGAFLMASNNPNKTPKKPRPPKK